MCPQCGSNVLLIKQQDGFERFLAIVTRKRAYCCRICACTFRMSDRRSARRDAKVSVPDRRTS